MEGLRAYLNRAVTAGAVTVALLSGQPAWAGDAAAIDRLHAELADPDNTAWQRTERELQREWSKSGSAAMDLLLQRGRRALREGDPQAAIEHLTALTDHAPEFAEGWNARATALFQADYYGPALDDIARALELNPRHFAALTGLGTILFETGQREAALKAYRAALELHPHQPRIQEAVRRLERETGGAGL